MFYALRFTVSLLELTDMRHHISIRLETSSITLGASWLLATPAIVWAIAALYVRIMAPSFNQTETWSVAAALTVLFVGSLLAHALGHRWAARALGDERPRRIPVYVFGDAAQVWPAAATPWQEGAIALAGPLANILIAGVAYLIWDLQWHPYVNISTLFLAGVNAGLALVNLAPGFPLDGGRLVRAIVWGLLARPARATDLGGLLGRWLAFGLAVWGVILIAHCTRYEKETGLGTILAAVVLLLTLRRRPTWEWDRPTPPRSLPKLAYVARGAMAGMLILVLLGITFALIPTTNGLEAPGVALSVEPMIEVPLDYRHQPAGTFILTTVIPQTPITAGQWVYGQLSPTVRIVPPERIVPPDTTPQELAERGNRMLKESGAIARVVALQLAGYDAQLVEAAQVVSAVAESPAHDVLRPGDWILEVNGQPIPTADALVSLIQAQEPGASVQLLIQRNEEPLRVTVPLMEPSAPGGPPRLGIAFDMVPADVDLPFPVEIEPQKISGGPSAGLMFTLTIYNLVMPEDLTGGRRIAGTGTISRDGAVGPIGGVEQKVAGAERAGAEYFLAPPENYADAHRVAGRIQVVEIATAQQAIDFLRGLPAAD
ncbi:MAG: putative protein YlbL [Anaerolineales bacterium]|nr:putative protein YlbL [Anaerolineales bacterium]